jgi:hypothetical protein
VVSVWSRAVRPPCSLPTERADTARRHDQLDGE